MSLRNEQMMGYNDDIIYFSFSKEGTEKEGKNKEIPVQC